MPYRRLPNTDKARMRAMKTALQNQQEEVELIIPYDFRIKLREVSNNFENKLSLKNSMHQKGISYNKKHTEITNKTRMYFSHFLQVVNMSIQRGELSKDVRLFYGIDREVSKLPDFTSDTQILKWGQQIIEGENNRMTKGGNRIYNPSLALVTINFEKFKESYEQLQNHQRIQERASTELNNYRDTADKYILKLWNILEQHFDCKNEVKFRTACSAWGISYVYRKSELEKLEKQRYAASISLSLDF